MNEQIEQWFAAGMLGIVQALMAAGASPNSALRLAAFVAIEGKFGREVTEGALGLPRSTAARWRAEIAALDGQALPEDVPVELVNQVLPLLGLSGIRVERTSTDG